MEQYAWLSAKLPTTKCRWFAPFLDMAATGYLNCKKCQQASMVMLTGKGQRTICRHCDSDKVHRHEAAFDHARQAALREGS
jgi:hypothetical protein